MNKPRAQQLVGDCHLLLCPVWGTAPALATTAVASSTDETTERLRHGKSSRFDPAPCAAVHYLPHADSSSLRALKDT